MKIFTIYFSSLILLIFSQQVSADTISIKVNKQAKDTLKLSETKKSDNNHTFKKDTLNVKVVDNVILKSEKKDHLNYIFPILTLILGFFLNRGYDYFAEKRRTRKEGERWIAELRCLDKPLQEQKELLEAFLKEHSIDKFDKPELVIHQMLNCEIFKSLDKSYLLKYLVTKEKDFPKAVNLSNNIHGFISSLNFFSNNIVQKFNEYLTKSSNHFSIFNEHLQQLTVNFSKYTVNLEKRTGLDPIHDVTYKKILELYQEHIMPHSEDGNIEIFDLQKKFIMPLAMIFSQNRLDDDLIEMSIVLSNCNMEIKAIRLEKRYLDDIFNAIIKHLIKSKEDLDKLLDKVK